MSYRETSLTCPGCREALAETYVGDALIDVCGACGGIWVDWFDGDLVVMVRGAPDVPEARLPEQRGSEACPRCKRPLEVERYLESNGEVLRCGDCAGAFVPRASVRALVGLVPEREPEEKDALRKLILVLRRWLGWDAPGAS